MFLINLFYKFINKMEVKNKDGSFKDKFNFMKSQDNKIFYVIYINLYLVLFD